MRKQNSLKLLLCILLTCMGVSAWGTDVDLASWTFTSGTAGTNYPSNKTNFKATSGTCTESTFYLNGSGSTWNTSKGYAFTAITSMTVTVKLVSAVTKGTEITFAGDMFYNKSTNAPVTGYNLTASINSGTASTTGLSATSISLSNSSATKSVTYTAQSDLAVGTTIALIYTQTGKAGQGQAFVNNIKVTTPAITGKTKTTTAFEAGSKSAYTTYLGETFAAPTATTTATGASGLAPEYSSSKTSTAYVNKTTGAVTIGNVADTAVITATFGETDDYETSSASYKLYVGKVFSSLENLVADGKPTKTGIPVKVSLTNETITKIAGTYGIFLKSGDQEVEIYCNGVPDTWVVNGTISGTITGDWKLYGTSTWEICPADWSQLNYTAPAKANQTITFDAKKYLYLGLTSANDSYTPTLNPGDGTLSAKSADESVAKATISNNVVTVQPLAAGSAKITVSATGTDNYNAKDTSYYVTVCVPASLPFEFDGGKSNLTTGMIAKGLGTDYSASPKLKFDNQGDSLVVYYGEAAGKLKYTIKGNSMSGDYEFDVEESADGVTYTTVKSYTSLGDAAEETVTLQNSSRFVRFCYSKKASGNVALGAIKIIAAGAKETPTFSIADMTVIKDETKTINVTTNSTGNVSYQIDAADEGKLEIEDGVVLAYEVGEYTVSATLAEDANYESASTTFTVTITEKPSYGDATCIVFPYGNDYYALQQDLSLKKVFYAADKLVNVSATDKAAMTWYMTKDDQAGTATFRDDEGKYLAIGSSNTVSTSENAVTWTLKSNTKGSYYTTAPDASSPKTLLMKDGTTIKNYAVSNCGSTGYSKFAMYTYEFGEGNVIGGSDLYETLEEALANVSDGQTITLLADIDATAQYEVSDKSVILDLNGHKIEYTGTTPLSSGVLLVHNGASLTINDSSDPDAGSIVAGTNAYAAVALTKKGDDSTNPATLIVNGGTLTGYYYSITGNGSRPNTVITINGGTINATCTGDNLGIYHPQNGTITVNGGTITGYSSAIEMRAGSLVVEGGTLTSTATSYSCNPNGSGTTTVGAAIAIAQHTTKVDISVSIEGGTISGLKALNECNPQNNDPAPQVTLSITGGTFTGSISTVDVDHFISGGTFDGALTSDQCAEGYDPVDLGGGKYGVKGLESIAITNPAKKTTFTIGEAFSYEGLEVTATYSDGSTAVVTPTVSTPDMTKGGTQTIVITYNAGGLEKTTSYNIVVKATPGSMDYETIDFTEVYKDVTSSQKMTTCEGGSFTMTFAKGSGSDPTYYKNGDAARVYANNTLTITALDDIKSVLVTYKGSYIDATAAVTGLNSKTATITFDKSCRFTSITVYYKAVERKNLTEGKYGTICLPYTATVTGGTVYSIAGYKGTEEAPTSMVLEEVTGDLVAGQPYIFCASASELTIANGETGVTVAGSDNGLIGSFEYTEVAEGNYLISNNKIMECGTGCSIAANRAYIDMSKMDAYNENNAAPGRIVELAFPIAGNVTGLDAINADNESVKFLRDGQIYILRGGKTYNLNGELLK